MMLQSLDRETDLQDQIEGIVKSLELVERVNGAGEKFFSVILTVESGERMILPAPKKLGGSLLFPCQVDVGKPVAARAVFVPAISKSGVEYTAKHFLFADPQNGPVDLEHCLTLEEYLETDYYGKP